MLEALQSLGPPGFTTFTKRTFTRFTRLYPDKKDLISTLFENSMISLHDLKSKNSKELTTFACESSQKSNLMVFNDELSSYEDGQPTEELSALLLKILSRELISREKAAKPFWDNRFKELSKNLWLPTMTDRVDSGSSLVKRPLPTPEETTQSLKIQETSHQSENLLKNFSQLSISTHVDKWIESLTKLEEPPQMKSLVIKINPTPAQRKKIDYDLQVSNYVYNKAVKAINKSISTKINKHTLRDQLVTKKSRKNNLLLSKINSAKTKIESIIKELKKKRSLKSVIKAFMIKQKLWRPIKIWYDHLRSILPPDRNDSLKEFELLTQKEIRTGSVFEACTNYSNCMKAVKAGRIKFFRLKYRSKKKNGMSMRMPASAIKIENGVLRFTARDLKDKIIKVNRRTKKRLEDITSLKDCRLTKKFGVYQLHIPLDVHVIQHEDLSRVIGIDPGVTTFLSGYTPDRTVLFKQTDRCERIDGLRQYLKQLRKDKKRKRIKRKLMTKLDLKKQHIIDELHWKSIDYLCVNYDIIFLEKFESQGFVKNGKSKNLNRNTNNHKPYQFRERLQYKALTHGKTVKLVDAHNTTKTCSSCGHMKKMTLANRVYECKRCKQVLDRDFNAAKNILMKGLLC